MLRAATWPRIGRSKKFMEFSPGQLPSYFARLIQEVGPRSALLEEQELDQVFEHLPVGVVRLARTSRSRMSFSRSEPIEELTLQHHAKGGRRHVSPIRSKRARLIRDRIDF